VVRPTYYGVNHTVKDVDFLRIDIIDTCVGYMYCLNDCTTALDHCTVWSFQTSFHITRCFVRLNGLNESHCNNLTL